MSETEVGWDWDEYEMVSGWGELKSTARVLAGGPSGCVCISGLYPNCILKLWSELNNN